MNKEKLTQAEKAWIIYDWGNSAYAMVITSSILAIYFSSMLAVANPDIPPEQSNIMATSYWGYANAIGSLIVAVLSPMLGSIADYMGMKKKLFSIFTLLGVGITGSLAFVPYGDWQMIMFLYVISILGFSFSNVFYDSLLTDVTEDKKMDHISSLGYAWGYIGGALLFLICMIFIIGAQQGFIPLKVQSATQLSFILTALWWLIFTFPMFKHVEQVHGKEYKKLELKQVIEEFFMGLGEIYRHKKVFMFLMAYFFYIDGVGTIIKMATSFATAIGIDSTTLLLVLLLTQFVAFPCSILYGKLSYQYGIKTMILVGIATYIVVSIVGLFLNEWLIWLLAVLVGSAQGGIQALSRSYFASMIPKENSNEYFGYYNIFGKFAAILGPLLLAVITDITNNPRYGVFSIIALFLIGGYLFIKSTTIKNDLMH